MNATEAIRAAITPVLPGWRIQLGQWLGDSAADRYAVIRPVGGGIAALVRRPQHTVTLIGSVGDAITDTQAKAEAVTEALRVNTSAGAVCLMAAEPAYSATDDGRPVFEMAVSAIN